jgi:hypothetical protein
MVQQQCTFFGIVADWCIAKIGSWIGSITKIDSRSGLITSDWVWSGLVRPGRAQSQLDR